MTNHDYEAYIRVLELTRMVTQCIQNCEKALRHELSQGEKVDLLLDNFDAFKDVADAIDFLQLLEYNKRYISLFQFENRKMRKK